MGQDTAREAEEAFYRAAPAYIETFLEKPLKWYFEHDNFGLAVQPRSHVTSIVFLLIKCIVRNDLFPGDPDRGDPLRLTQQSVEATFGSDQNRLPAVTFWFKDDIGSSHWIFPSTSIARSTRP
jgi:hypothetical protein